MRPSYSAPHYSPPPPSLYHPSSNPNVNYRAQQQSQQQAHQTFQQMQRQQRQQMQDRYYYNSYSRQQQQLALRRPLSPEQLQARQQQAELKATEQLAQLTQQQQRRRQEHPAADAQQAAAQQQADAKQFTVLNVEIYREVYLPGQFASTLQSLTLPRNARQDLQAINDALLNNAWWRQEPAQAPAKVAAYGSMLAAHTTALLGFDPASPPSAPLAANALDEMLAKDTFDRSATAQLLQTAAQTEKRLAGARLAQAVKAFQDVGAKVAASQGAPQDLKQQRSEVKKSLRRVNKELAHYNSQVGNSGNISQVQKTILKSTADYLAKNGS